MANPFTSKTAGASALDFLAPDVAQDQRRLDRRQQLADLLLAQAVQPTDTGTQSVGGWAIPNNQIKPFEKLGMALIANRSQSRVDEQRADLAKRYAEALSKGMAGTGEAGGSGPSMNQALAMSALGLNVPPKVMERIFNVVEKKPVNIDAGGRQVVGAFDPVTGETTTVSEFEKSASPDAVMRDQTTRRGQDLTQSTTLRGQDITLRGQDITQGTAIRGQDMTAETARLLGSPESKANVARAVEDAKAQGAAARELPGAQSQVGSLRTKVEELKGHPGLTGSVGMKDSAFAFGMFDEPIAGTDEANFMARLNELKGTAFLEAYDALKGGGPVTEIEGKKAEAAMARLDTAQSNKEFKAALDDFLAAAERGLAKLEAKAGASSPAASSVAPPATQSAGDWQTLPNGVRVRVKPGQQ